MLKQTSNWKRPLFCLLLPGLVVMACLGFPVPVAPPPATRPAQEQTVVVKKKKRRFGRFLLGSDADADADRDRDGA